MHLPQDVLLIVSPSLIMLSYPPNELSLEIMVMVLEYSLAILALVMLSAFFSGSEIAMFSANRYRLQAMVRRNKSKTASLALGMLDNPSRLLSSILVCNNIVNVLSPVMATLLGEKLFGHLGVAVAGGVVTILLILLGEVVPKSFASRHAESYACMAAYPIFLLSYALWPLVTMVDWVAKGFMRLSGRLPSTDGGADVDEIRAALSQSKRIDGSHRLMILGVLGLREREVCDIMTPAEKINYLDLSKSDEELIEKIFQARHELLPICSESDLNQVKGLIQVRRAMLSISGEKLDRNRLLSSMRYPLFVPERMSAMMVLTTLLKSRQRAVMVVDAYGEVEGMATHEDVLKHITQSLDGSNLTQIGYEESSKVYVLYGQANLQDIHDHFGLSFDAGLETKTLSGLIVEELESLPKGPLCLRLGKTMVLEVLAVQESFIERVRIRLTKDGDPIF